MVLTVIIFSLGQESLSLGLISMVGSVILYRILNTVFKRFNDKSIVTGSRFEKKIEEGYAFSSSERFASVANGSTVEMVFQNPSGSGRDVNIIAVEIIPFGRGHIDIYENSKITDEGSQAQIFNLNMGSSNSSVCKVLYNGTYSGGDLKHKTVAYGGRSVRAIGSLSEVGEKVKITEGKNIRVVFTNKAGVDIDVSMRFLWWEE